MAALFLLLMLITAAVNCQDEDYSEWAVVQDEEHLLEMSEKKDCPQKFDPNIHTYIEYCPNFGSQNSGRMSMSLGFKQSEEKMTRDVKPIQECRPCPSCEKCRECEKCQPPSPCPKINVEKECGPLLATQKEVIEKRWLKHCREGCPHINREKFCKSLVDYTCPMRVENMRGCKWFCNYTQVSI